MDHLANLNNEQREAVLHKDGPLLVFAGAGSGKTKTLTHRIINLIKKGVNPENILAITFTNKAASEMRERTLGLIEKSGLQSDQKPLISTFHSLGVKILRENFRELGLPKQFSILDDSDATSLLRESIKENNLDPKQYEARRFKNIISRQKGNFITLEQFEKDASEFIEKLTARVWRKYDELKNKEKALDFDDLLLKTVLLLKRNEELKKNYQNRFKYIHVDEYQDTNQIQYELCKLLTGENKNICVVGDSDQNIYSWRGANLKNILHFEKDYPGAKVIILEENYRSTQNILEAANEVIKKNKQRIDKNLFTKSGTGEKINLYEAFDENDEADFVATKILEIMDNNAAARQFFRSSEGGQPDLEKLPSGSARENSVIFTELNDMAILYRANFQSRVLEEALLTYNIPYQVLGVKFFERKEIKDLLSYLRAALNQDSLSDIKRVINLPARGIGKTTIAKIFAGQKESLPEKMQIKILSFYNLLEKIKEYALIHPVSETMRFIIKETEMEKMLAGGDGEDLERLENIKELVTLTKKYDGFDPEEGLEKLLEEAALMSDQDTLKDEKNGVRLMTVHASKGLEFKQVFIVGLEQDLFPHARDENASSEEKEEERRLFYVALTRAREKLYLSFANTRMIFGKRQFNTPSEFLFDIPEDLIEKEKKQYLSIKSIYI